jgi:2-dehydropantoate 2-reductase
LGGFYGARLQRAGCTVHFLLHSDYDHVARHGLFCESKDGNFTLPAVKAYRDARDLPPCDVALVALKTTQNNLLPDLLPPAVKPQGVVVMMQNGLGQEEIAAGIVGADRVMGGLAFLCSNKVSPGHIRHLDYGLVALGEFSRRGITGRMRAIAGDFQRAGLPVDLEDDLRVARWKKLVWNIPYNGLSVLLNATTKELMDNPLTRSQCEALMREVVAAANGCGVPLAADIVNVMLERTAKMTPYRTSMKIDFDEGRPMEIEAIFGNPLRAAKAAGVATPELERVYLSLKASAKSMTHIVR